MAARVFVVIILALVAVQSLAGDPSPVQDFCVADLNSKRKGRNSGSDTSPYGPYRFTYGPYKISPTTQKVPQQEATILQDKDKYTVRMGFCTDCTSYFGNPGWNWKQRQLGRPKRKGINSRFRTLSKIFQIWGRPSFIHSWCLGDKEELGEEEEEVLQRIFGFSIVFL